MTAQQLIDALAQSRAKFLRHVEGMTEEQCRWKPYPECMSVNDTLMHLMIDDLAAIESLDTKAEPSYEKHREEVHAQNGNFDHVALLERLAETHQLLIGKLKGEYGSADLDTNICIWGDMKPLGLGIPFLATEDSYHSGQVSFIRQAQDPSWNYYAAIYGAE